DADSTPAAAAASAATSTASTATSPILDPLFMFPLLVLCRSRRRSTPRTGDSPNPPDPRAARAARTRVHGTVTRKPLGLRFGPVVADADVDGERRVERIGADHLGADELAHSGDLGVGHLEQELVVD